MEVRMDGGPPWGFTLIGGIDFRSPLRIGKVSANGKAERAGVQPGNYLMKVNGTNCDGLKHMEAQRLVKNARDTLELELGHEVEMRRKSSQSLSASGSRRSSTQSLPRGMTSFSSIGSIGSAKRLSYHDTNDIGSFRSPRSSSSSITDYSGGSLIPSKPAPPPGSSNKRNSFTLSGSVSASAKVEDHSELDNSGGLDTVFSGSSVDETDHISKPPSDSIVQDSIVRHPETQTQTLSARPAPIKPVLSSSDVKKPPAVSVKPIRKLSAGQAEEKTTMPTISVATTKQEPQPTTERSPPAATTDSQAVKKEPPPAVHKPTKMVAQHVTRPAAYIPQSGGGGGSSWYKSMFRSIIANDDTDEVTIPENAYSPPIQRKSTSKLEPASTKTAPPLSSTNKTETTMTSAATVRKPEPPTVKSSPAVAKSEPTVIRSTPTVTAPNAVTSTGDSGMVNSSRPAEKQYSGSTSIQSSTEPAVDAATKHSVNNSSKATEFMTSAQVRAANRKLCGGGVAASWRAFVNESSHVEPAVQRAPAVHKPNPPPQHRPIHQVERSESPPAAKIHPLLMSGAAEEEEEDLTPAEEHVTVETTTTVSQPPTSIPDDDADPSAADSLKDEEKDVVSDFLPEVSFQKMHPIVAEAAGENDNSQAAAAPSLKKTTSESILNALEELSAVIDTTTSTVGRSNIVAPAPTFVIEPESSSKSVDGDVQVAASSSSMRVSNSDSSVTGMGKSLGASDEPDHSGLEGTGRGSVHLSSNQSSRSNSSMGSRRSQPPPAASARALFSFSAQHLKELSFKKGAVINLTRTVDPNWLEGELDGIKGIFPRSYVELITRSATQSPAAQELTPSPTPSASDPHAVARFNFKAESAKELGFSKGDILYLHKRVDDNWFKGKNSDGKTGIFPCSFVQVVVDLPENVEYVKSTTPPVNAEFIIEDKATTHSSQSPQPTTVQASTAAESTSDAHSKTEVAEDTTDSFNVVGDQYECLYSYVPCNSDELALQAKDTVVVFERCNDGWYMGVCQRTGEVGVFPGNYVRKLD